MAKEWQELAELTGGKSITVEKVRITENDITIKGSFELPPIARLTTEDQIFMAAFVKTHGSIKEMERIFGVSYPTIKNRLNRISGQLDFIEIDLVTDIHDEESSVETMNDPLDLLETGQIDVSEALKLIKNQKKE
jgi:hypothetical protein